MRHAAPGCDDSAAPRGADGRRRDRGRHRARARDRARRRRRRRPGVLGRGAPAPHDREPPRATSTPGCWRDRAAARSGRPIGARMALAMEFGFLRDPERKLLSIGYLAAEGALDANCYDLLASEARLASFVAIAKGDVPARHWFRLGRAVTPIAHGAALISWSGSMFEYLMPSLVMRAPAGSLLEQTSRLIVRRQIDLRREPACPGASRNRPTTSATVEFTYQYSNFGVPGLGLKRGLGENRSSRPTRPRLRRWSIRRPRSRNLARLAAPARRAAMASTRRWITRRAGCRKASGGGRAAFMAHHQGMTIVAIADAPLDGIMRDAVPRRADRPGDRAAAAGARAAQRRDGPAAADGDQAGRHGQGGHAARRPPARHRARRDAVTHLLSNGRYAVMLTAAGSGNSRWGDLAVTRWREDPTCDDWGSYILLRDVGSGGLVGGLAADRRRAGRLRRGVRRGPGRVRPPRRPAHDGDGGPGLGRGGCGGPPHLGHQRRQPRARRSRSPPTPSWRWRRRPADIAHPAFAKMFVQTE